MIKYARNVKRDLSLCAFSEQLSSDQISVRRYFTFSLLAFTTAEISFVAAFNISFDKG